MKHAKQKKVKENTSKIYINRGYIDLDDKVVFKKIVDACNCFGHNYRGYQRGMARHPIEKDKALWFPKLYENEDWQNKIVNDGKTIIEKRKANNPEFIKTYLLKPEKFPRKRIVFARESNSFGDLMYCFKGLFEVNEEKSQNAQAIIYERIKTKVETYSAK